jgi:hypothetical protein
MIKLLPLLMVVLSISISKTHEKTPAQWSHFYHMELSSMASLVDFIMVIFKKYQPWMDTSLLWLEINSPGFNGVQHIHIHIKKTIKNKNY